MLIRLKKGRDGPDALACVRDDGTTTWRRIQRGLALHDLAHYAVETELGLAGGFYGLVASGWDLEALVSAEHRPRIPPEGLWVEHVVAAFLTGWSSAVAIDAAALDEQIAHSAAKSGLASPRRIAGEEVERVCAAFEDLVARWRALPPGGTLELPFAPARARA